MNLPDIIVRSRLSRDRTLRLTVSALLLLACSAGQIAAQSTPPAVRTFKAKTVATHGSTAAVSSASLQLLAWKFQQWKLSNDVLARCPELLGLKGLRVPQILAYGTLKDEIRSFEAKWDETGSVPIVLRGEPLERAGDDGRAPGGMDVTAGRFFSRYRDLLRIKDPSSELVPESSFRNCEGGRSIRYAQVRDGVPVWGKELILQFDAAGDIDLLTGRFAPTPEAMFTDAIDADEAVQRALAVVAAETPIEPLSADAGKLLDYRGPSVQRALFVEPVTDSGRSVFVVEIRPNFVDRMRVFVDAHSGAIVRKYNASCTDGPEKATATDLLGQTRTIDTYLFQGTHYMIDASRPMFDAAKSTFPNDPAGAIMTLDARNTDLTQLFHNTSTNNSWNAPAAVSAHYNAAQTYEYYRTTHNRNAIDGNGSTIISVVNVTSNGQPMDNAFWNGKVMAYGNGNTVFKPLAAALDVGAHEMTHGVTEHSANLEYLKQSGALNESFSDVFGAMVDRANWTMGEDIMLPSPDFPTGALRDLSDPHNGGTTGSPSWQPAHMSEYQNLSENQDNGGVHVNSGIPNKVAYLVSDGPNGVGRDETEKIFYCALTTKLTKQAQFIDYRLALVQCAEELFGANSNAVIACKSACDAVGILDGNPTKTPGDLPEVNGPDHMLFVDVDPSSPISLWTVVPPATAQNDFNALSQTLLSHRPAVADDGSLAVFVDLNRDIRVIALDPAAPNEQVLDNTHIWESIALSRDERLLAVTTAANEAKIHVFDISGTTPRLHSFDLYTPNYSQTGVPNVAQYADAMDFEPSGEHLVFDLYNEMNIAGSTVGFWDINVMNVWDAAAGDFGNGKIERVFPQEPSIDIGNPTFARNKTTVIAFDLQIPTTQESYIMAVNLLDGDAKTIAQIPYGDPGFPSYRGDDAVISFGALPNGSGSPAVFNVGVDPDGITANTQPSMFGQVIDAIYPIWYRIGQRPSAVQRPAIAPGAPVLAQNYPNPFNPSTVIPFTLAKTADVRIIVTDALGRRVRTLLDARRDPGTYTVSWDGRGGNGAPMPSGVYRYTLSADGRVVTRSMLLVK